MPKIFSFASINIDEVYSVPHIVRPGETLTSTKRQQHAGGKGTNASIAAARSGHSHVTVIGKIGPDGLWIRTLIESTGANIDHITVLEQTPTGRAIIQVDDAGENAIFLFPGANHMLTQDDARKALAVNSSEGDWLLLTNETTAVVEAMRVAKDAGMQVLWNPAPVDSRVVANGLVDVLVANESELAEIARQQKGKEADGGGLGDCAKLARQVMLWMGCHVIAVTLGSKGSLGLVRLSRLNTHEIAIHATKDNNSNSDSNSSSSDNDIVEIRMACAPVGKDQVKDTTGAGDTWVGYFAAELARKQGDSPESIGSAVTSLTPSMVEHAMRVATYASGLAVTQMGAVTSIPHRAQVDEFLKTKKTKQK
ncbi:putative ribokinase [Kickxella alabastrina]|uniref:Ribokinase n=1 Tax=Kickxella alabastrina TaxID=61397 RepID=A0ACC1IMG5_9FUNG|nr:putative ribokinase [Kickxella alabastrina]